LLQIDLESVFQREGEVPYQRLQQLLAEGSSGSAEAVQMTQEVRSWLKKMT
jgi:hypothetical protein